MLEAHYARPKSQSMSANPHRHPITNQHFMIGVGVMALLFFALLIYSLMQDGTANAQDVEGALSDVPKECRVFVSTRMRFEIMDKAAPLDTDDLSEIVDMYAGLTSKECAQMNEQLAGTDQNR